MDDLGVGGQGYRPIFIVGSEQAERIAKRIECSATRPNRNQFEVFLQGTQFKVTGFRGVHGSFKGEKPDRLGR